MAMAVQPDPPNAGYEMTPPHDALPGYLSSTSFQPQPGMADLPVLPYEEPSFPAVTMSESTSAVTTLPKDPAPQNGSSGPKDSSEPANDAAKPAEAQTVSFKQLLSFADGLDVLLLTVGVISAAGNGVAMPLFSLVFGDLVDIFGPAASDDDEELLNSVMHIGLWFLYLGVGTLVCSIGELACIGASSHRQVNRLRAAYLAAILRQDVSFYDTQNITELSSRIAADTQAVQSGLDKIGPLVHHSSTFISGFIVGFVAGWQLTLVVLATTPLMAAGGAVLGVVGPRMTKRSADAYAAAGAIVEETLSNIRTVMCFGQEDRHCSQYNASCALARSSGERGGVLHGLGVGLVDSVMMLSYAISFWYGAKLIADRTHNTNTGVPWTSGDVVAVFFSIVMAGFAVGQAQPAAAALTKARVSAYRAFSIIERVPPIDSRSTVGQEPPPTTHIAGNIQLANVTFTYPSRPEAPVLRDFTLTVPDGSRVALVGESGCGKSTIVSLLLRLYDPDSGTVHLNGTDVRNYRLGWLRRQIGIVSQEPTLFAMSIRENIAYGKHDGAVASMDEIIAAAKVANAHDFISALPEGYATPVGHRATQLSGGQKQRIAIARAVIRDPRVLLLDEATSALDTESERLVQRALDSLMEGRTSIVIAHRLSTVRDCTTIVVLSAGRIMEMGTYDSLLAQGGLFSTLAQRQLVAPSTPKAQPEASWLPLEAVSTPTPTRTLAPSDFPAHKENKEEDTNSKAKDGEEEEGKGLVVRVLRMVAPDAGWLLLAVLCASANGLVYPLFSIIFADILQLFQSADVDKMMDKALVFCGLFVGLAVLVLLANGGQQAGLSIAGERLTYKIRTMCFSAVTRHGQAWFDSASNGPGAVGARLSADAALVRGATSDQFGLVAQNIVTLVAGVLIAFISGWKLSLVVLASLPLIGVASAIEMKFFAGEGSENEAALGTAGDIVTESVNAIRTVAALGLESRISEAFGQALVPLMRSGIKKAMVAGVAYGFSQFIMFAVFGACFYYGGRLVLEGEWSLDNIECDPASLEAYGSLETCIRKIDLAHGFGEMLTVFFAIVMAAMGMGQAQQFAPDVGAANKAMVNSFKLIDHRSDADPASTEGQAPCPGGGCVEFQGVSFAYPSRPDAPVLKNFSLVIAPGRVTALVGQSGGGKSTTLLLLQRLYDPDAGRVLLDGMDLKSLNLRALREQLSLVSQEPTLFSMSIRENIAYGKPDATLQEIEAAAGVANAHEFITKLPQGYDTPAGDTHTQLSGGQKQRIAIARAVIRNPRVLLLDEATSALDTESERLVQQALDGVMRGRTSIVIAHRLSTVQNADAIAVIQGGGVVEIGQHSELLGRNGAYAALAGRLA